MKTNYHTHTTWCDGKNTPEETIQAAIAKGFDALGFSSHALLPVSDPWTLQPDTAARYVAEIRALSGKYKGRLRISCGMEADFIPGETYPERRVYAPFGLDFLIGSVHYVKAGGVRVPVDHKPQLHAEGINLRFGGDV